MKKLFGLLITLSLISCSNHVKNFKNNSGLECTTLFGIELSTPEAKEGQAYTNYLEAKKIYESDPANADALIWYGRRAAYMGWYQEAINIFSEGIKQFPEDARFYRHRGHRYISARKYEWAITDFLKAIELIEDTEDQTEPDGLPNSRNLPLSTLHGNIWYHLGLAYYLQNDLEKAYEAFSNRSVLQKYDDNIVSGTQWLYMILRRMGEKEGAVKKLAMVYKDMDIIENMSYHQMCLFYKGELSVEELKMDDVALYSLGNWYLYEMNDTAKAKVIWEELLSEGTPFSFAFIACEADYVRLFKTEE